MSAWIKKLPAHRAPRRPNVGRRCKTGHGFASERNVVGGQERTISIARFTLQSGVLPVGMELVINRVHIIPMGMANAYLIEATTD